MTEQTVKIAIVAEYCISSEIIVDLPPGKQWSDVEEWFVKWDQLNYRLKGEEEFRQSAYGSLSMESCDTKRPLGVTIELLDDDWQYIGEELDSI